MSDNSAVVAKSDTKIPECADLYEEAGYTEIETSVIDTWRWGTVNETIYQSDENPNEFWAASYRVSTDRETDELREGDAQIYQVEKREVTTYKWFPV